MTTFEKESQSFQDENYHAHLDRNWQSGNKKLEAQDERINKLGNIRYYGANEVTQARTGVDGKQHKTLASRMDDMELETQNARGGFGNLSLKEEAQDKNIKTNADDIKTSTSIANNAISIAKSAVSGAPKASFANLAALKSKYPNGASGVFITSDNGHVWSYNGGSWIDLGQYQGAEVADGSVGTEKLSNEFRINGLSVGGNIILRWDQGYVASKTKERADGTKEGTIVTGNEDFSISQPIVVHTGDKLVVEAQMGSMGVTVSQWTANGEYVKSLADGLGEDMKIVVYASQQGLIRICNWTAKKSNDTAHLHKYPKLYTQSLPNSITSAVDWQKMDLDWENRTYYASDIHPSNPNEFVQGTAASVSNQMSETFYVTKGTVVSANAGCSRFNWAISEFTWDGQTPVKGLVRGDSVTGDTSTDFKSYYFDHNAYVRICNNTSIISDVTIRTSRVNNDSNLNGKSINMIGDSYVANNSQPIENTWHYKMAQKHNMTYANYGINGNGLVTPNKTDTPVSERIATMKSADYIVVVGGRNDYNDQYPIADFTAGIDKIIKDSVSNFSEAKLCFFTPWSIGDTDTKEIKQVDYVKAIQEECNKFGIACFNSYKKAGMSMWDAGFRKKYAQSDGDVSHLNADGHDRFMPRAEQFINGL